MLICIAETRIIQLQRPADEQLPLFEGEARQLLEHFVKAHSANTMERMAIVSFVARFNDASV